MLLDSVNSIFEFGVLHMTERTMEVEEENEKNDEDRLWLTAQLQELVNLASEKGLDEYVACFTFLMFAHELNNALAPDRLVATGVSLKVIAQLLFEEHDEHKKNSTETTIEEFQMLEHLPENARLH